MTRHASTDARRGRGRSTRAGRAGRKLPHPASTDVPAAPPAPTSGTLASHDDTDDLPVVDEGVAVGPDELGQQFLRNATEQNNFEREAALADLEPEPRALGQLISEATLGAAGQEDREIPASTALSSDEIEDELEPESNEGSLLSRVARDASLFDQPRESESEQEELAESALEADEVRALDEHRAPPGVDEEAREEEKRRLRRRLLENPDRGHTLADREAEEEKRRQR